MLPENELQNYITRYGLPEADDWEEAATTKTFEKQIKKIRLEQHTVQVTHGQIVGLAVPVLDSGRVVASIGVYMPQYRFKGPVKEKAIKVMKEHAARISKRLG